MMRQIVGVCVALNVSLVMSLSLSACKGQQSRSVQKTMDAVNVEPDDVLSIPDSLFPYSYFVSTSDAKMFHIRGDVYLGQVSSDTLVNGKVLKDLPMGLKKNISDVVAQELSADSGYVEQYVQIYPISKYKGCHHNELMIFEVEGDDLSGKILVNRNDRKIPNYTVILSGGVSAGPEYEDDRVLVLFPDIATRIKADTLWKRMTFRAMYEQDETRDGLKREDIKDSGLLILKMTESGLDTIGKFGVLDVKDFIKKAKGIVYSQSK